MQKWKNKGGRNGEPCGGSQESVDRKASPHESRTKCVQFRQALEMYNPMRTVTIIILTILNKRNKNIHPLLCTKAWCSKGCRPRHRSLRGPVLYVSDNQWNNWRVKILTLVGFHGTFHRWKFISEYFTHGGPTAERRRKKKVVLIWWNHGFFSMPFSLCHPFSAFLRIKKHMTVYRTKNISVITQEYNFFFPILFFSFPIFLYGCYGDLVENLHFSGNCSRLEMISE